MASRHLLKRFSKTPQQRRLAKAAHSCRGKPGPAFRACIRKKLVCGGRRRR